TSKTPSYTKSVSWQHHLIVLSSGGGNDSNLLIVFYVQIMPDDLVMQLHRF
ncbi:transposase, partial [Shigella sonnei]